MKVAICTTDGAEVDLHFGKTETFYIYEVKGGGQTLVEKRNVESYCSCGDEPVAHDFDKPKFDKIFETIKDCDKLYTVRIGDAPLQKLQEQGMEVKLCSCAVDSIPTCSGNCK